MQQNKLIINKQYQTPMKEYYENVKLKREVIYVNKG